MQLRSSRLALLAVTALAVGTLTACAPEPDPAPSWTASASPEVAEPLFASDEEALAAATAAYARYLVVTDEVLSTGGQSPHRLHEVAIGQALEYELAGARDFAESGLYATGSTVFTVHRLQSVKPHGSGGSEVRFYVCDDLSNADLFDQTGVSQADPAGQVIFPFEIAVVGQSNEGLKVAEKNLWTGGGFC